MTGIFNIEQITQGKTLDDWYKPANHHEEKQVATRKPNGAAAPTRDTILAIFKPGAWMKKSAIAKTLGVSPDTLTWHIGKLLVDKELIAQGNTGNRAFALPGTAEPRVSVSVAEANGSKKPKAAAKPFKFKPATRTPPPKAKTQPPAPAACNVTDFTPALTADRRLVIVGGTEPLIFSPEQTRNIATLMANFGA